MPSKEQVHGYLVAQTKRPEGLNSPLITVQGHRFDAYLLFKLVVQLGGSTLVRCRSQGKEILLTHR